MCDASAEYSTVVGPRSAMWELMEIWERLETPRRFDISRPDPIQFWQISRDAERLFSNPKVPNIAVVHHQQRMGIHITAALQAELTVGNSRRDITPFPSSCGSPDTGLRQRPEDLTFPKKIPLPRAGWLVRRPGLVATPYRQAAGRARAGKTQTAD